MIVEVTKEFIIDALNAERIEVLRPGTWFVNPSTDEGLIQMPKENCPRCAVGAVVNRVLLPETKGTDIFNVSGKITAGALVVPSDDEDLDETYLFETALHIMKDPLGKPMSALSFFFEGSCILEARVSGVDDFDDCDLEDLERVVARARKETISFVRDCFPATVKIDINGFEPAKDVQVVET